MSKTTQLHQQIEARVRVLDPSIELIAVDQSSADRLQVFIDHPAGVDLALCERVTNHLGDLRSEFSLEVSSPGAERRLTKPEHFRRFLGRRVRVKTTEQIDGASSFTGTLAEADGERVRVDGQSGAVTIPLARIRHSNLVGEPNGGAS